MLLYHSIERNSGADTEITKRSDDVLITTGISTTAAVGATAKTTMELLISMRVSEEGGLIK
jgi:hypothetical protein